MNHAVAESDSWLAQDREKRRHDAEASLGTLEVELTVLADLPFWLRRIRRACKRGFNHTSNRWSFHGDVSERYQQELSRRLGPTFIVDRTYYTGPLDLMEPCVVVSW